MATLLDRVLHTNDWVTDGGELSAQPFGYALCMYTAGLWTAANIKTQFDMTTSQGAQLDAILATRPAAPLLLLNVPAYVQWADKVIGIIWAAQAAWPPFDTEAEVKTALGIS